MVTKGEIQSIDYQGNTCIVRLPYFESAGIKDNIQAEATINNQPGMYNGYKAGDIVWVAFEDGEASQPVVIGKLYLGANKERNDPRGVVNAESSIISNNIQLPITTKIVYETDGTVAQNGITRYNTLSDITNELGKLSGKQSLTTVDMAGLTTTANQIKAEVSSIKSQTGLKADYIQADEPKSPNYVEWAAYTQFTSADQYVGFYINIGTETERKYIEITDENKEVWITNPGVQTAYKEQELKENNTWLYTGDDLYEKEDQPANITDFIGCYVYCEGAEDNYTVSKEAPEEKECPVSNGHGHTTETTCYKPKDANHLFILISSDNKSKITDVENTVAYKIHLAKNTAFRVASIENNKATWEETTLSYIKGFASSITQTDKSIDAKVSKKYSDDSAVDFGWNILQADDTDITAAKKAYYNEGDKTAYTPGDEAGQFNIYSKITYTEDSGRAPETKNVFHANRNGVTINGNLTVTNGDSTNPTTIFQALPYGKQDGDADDKGTVRYDGKPLVEIGNPDLVGNKESVWLSPTTATREISIADSYARDDWALSCGDGFGVTKQGEAFSTDLSVDGLDFMALTDGSNNFSDVTVSWDSDNYCFNISRSFAADKTQDVHIWKDNVFDIVVTIPKGSSSTTSQPLIGLSLSDADYQYTPKQISDRVGSFTNTAGFFNDKNYCHAWGTRYSLATGANQIEGTDLNTQWWNYPSATSLARIISQNTFSSTDYENQKNWKRQKSTWKAGDILAVSWTSKSSGGSQYLKASAINPTSFMFYQAKIDGSFSGGTWATWNDMIACLNCLGVRLQQKGGNFVIDAWGIICNPYNQGFVNLTVFPEVITDNNISSGSKCYLYIPKSQVYKISSICVTPYWADFNKYNVGDLSYTNTTPIIITVVDEESYTYNDIEYHRITIQLDVSIAAKYDDSSSAENIDITNLKLNIMCYGEDNYYTDTAAIAIYNFENSNNTFTKNQLPSNIAEIIIDNMALASGSYGSGNLDIELATNSTNSDNIDVKITNNYISDGELILKEVS